MIFGLPSAHGNCFASQSRGFLVHLLAWEGKQAYEQPDRDHYYCNLARNKVITGEMPVLVSKAFGFEVILGVFAVGVAS